MRKSLWLVSTGLVAFPSAAFAQNADQTAQPSAASPTEQAAVQPQPKPNQPDDIVITAQGRRQLLQNVPIAVTAVGGQDMRNSGATDIRQLNQLAPSLLVSSTSTEANGSARIRGIGTVGDNPGLESSVAVFVDGVYRSRSGIGLNELGGIDRIEVLRGPQGTLFGRNASAGLIHVFSKKPAFDWNAYGEATIGNFDMRRLEAGITGPIADTADACFGCSPFERRSLLSGLTGPTDGRCAACSPGNSAAFHRQAFSQSQDANGRGRRNRRVP